MNNTPEESLLGSPTPGSGPFPHPTPGESRVPRHPAILLVEDNPSDVLLVREAFQQGLTSGVTLVEVDRLSSALLKLAEERFDLILLELSLPDSQGIETLRTVRERASDIPIVVCTGLADDVLGVQAVQAGAQDYLVKSEINRSLLVRSMCYAIERHRLKTQLETTSLLDELCGLHNRRGFLILGKQQMRNAQRLGGAITLLFIDVDGMKRVNDRFGHQEGDLALRDTAEIMRRTFRQSDILARIGGDEFIVMASLPPGVSTDVLISRLHMHLDSCQRAHQRSYTLSLSVGAETHAVSTETSLEELLAQADKRMYEQKRRKTANAGSPSNHNPSRIPKKKPAGVKKPLPGTGFPNTKPTTTSPSRAISGDGNHRTVLLVEDEKSLRTLLRQSLAQNGYCVLEAGDGKEALQLADMHKGKIDLLVTDVVMPEMNGPELVAAITKVIPNLPVLYMSGYQENVLLRLRVNCSGPEVLEKPFYPRDLIAKIEVLLSAAPVTPGKGERAGDIKVVRNSDRTPRQGATNKRPSAGGS